MLGAQCWQRFRDEGVTAIYGPGRRLAAVAVSPSNGPQVRLDDIELIFRPPSHVRSDLRELATREGVPIRVNWSGDPEVAAWGLSMGAEQQWAPIERHQKRLDTMCTAALFVCLELANDPYQTAPVITWRDVREKRPNSGTWPVKPEAERPRWDWTPMTRVGPLRFGMDPQQVAAGLDGEEPAIRQGRFPLPVYRTAGQWTLQEDHFDVAWVTPACGSPPTALRGWKA
ncbi:hypothetical protein ACIA5C_07835 [Actinoplanes sp. NPDC051343]|uniref:hypothetical protein n=1 Tax=Actinoplanes sp. NPDC051343 TaxID=3363906 RepID=UPI0037897692